MTGVQRPIRRQRLRAETMADINRAASTQLSEVGAPQLSLRGVAAELGMSPAGLYRYVDSRDALLTSLIAECFDALADAIEQDRDAVSSDDPAKRALAAMLAFRGWAQSFPREFELLYGTPIPGYQAPADGPTSVATRRVGAALLTPFVQAWRSGRLRPPLLDAKTKGDPALASWAAAIQPDLPADVAAALLSVWTRLHGLVIMETFGHLNWLGPDRTQLMTAQLRAMVTELIGPHQRS